MLLRSSSSAGERTMPISSAAPVVPRKSDDRKEHEFERSPYTSVSTFTLNYRATDRIVTLSKPKERQESAIRDGYSRYLSNPRYSGVSHAAANAESTPRLDELAVPVKLHQDHRYEYPSPRPVSGAALRYRATSKVIELGQPRKPPGER